jgi:hypothetical protein
MNLGESNLSSTKCSIFLQLEKFRMNDFGIDELFISAGELCDATKVSGEISREVL